MHLQHPKSIDSVRIYAPSPAKRYGLMTLAFVAYAASLTACYRTAGVPYAKALEEGKALDDQDHARLAQKAAQHSAKLQRQKAQKLVELIVDQQIDDADNKTKANSERKKAEKALKDAALLAEHTMASIKRSENKTDLELAIEIFGEDYVPEPEKEDDRSLPSKRLPSAAACLFLFLVLTFHALYHLMCRWVVPFKAYTLFTASTQMNNRAYALILPKKHKGRPSLCPVRSARVGAGLVIDYQRQLYEYWGPEEDQYETDDESVDIVEEEEDVIGKGKEHGSLRKVTPPLTLAVAHYATAEGLDARSAESARERYGKNVVEVRVPGFLELYREQLLSPIAMFQVFTSLLWLLDAYWQYVGFTLFSIVTMEAGTVMQRRKTMQSLSGMSAAAAPVLCFRRGRWQDVSSDELLPGDLISICRRKPPPLPVESPQLGLSPQEAAKRADAKKEFEKKRNAHFRAQPAVVPCDCVLVQGSAVTNEATLTGESTPQMKDALDASEDRALSFEGADRISTLFSGTDLVNATAGEGKHAPPDHGAVAYVLRTGFSSAQGELMQMIEFSQQGVSSDTFETLLALGILLLFALASAAYVFREGLRKGDRTTHELLLRCVIIVTSVVPRQLPMQMALAVNTALMALIKCGVMAVEPYRVPFAGRLEHCLFDKTGTLTTDRLVPAGVVGSEGGPVLPFAEAPLKASIVIAACHALVGADDDDTLVGDPIELTAVRALGWTYDPKSSIAKGPRTCVKIKRRFHFSSALQRMSVVAEVDGQTMALVKGSPETVGALLKDAPAWFEPAYASLAEKGLRVLALASRVCEDAETRSDVERDLELCGLAAFECKTRADSRVVVTALTQSAHRVAMVTGDAPLTALHVARECAIVDRRPAWVLEACVDGAQWVNKSTKVPFAVEDVPALAAQGPLVVTEKALKAAASADEEAVWRSLAQNVHVFARMSPQGKARLVRSLQALHDAPSVLMCGDGGNDVGALKQADVGLALLAGYGDANTTGKGGYADAAEKLAAAKGDVSAEALLNAQKEALEDAHRDAGAQRKTKIDAAQKDVATKQKEWLEEEMAKREARGETGFLASAGAVKDVALRMKREMEAEVRKIDSKMGNIYDKKDEDPLAQARKMLEGSETGLQMIRPGDASVAAPFTSRAPSIRAVVDLIRQGRCTLLSSLQQQQIMVLESVISAYTLAALSLEGARSSERQMMASGWLLVVASLAFSYATPIESMHPIRPLGSLFHPSICASVAGQGAIHVFCMRRAVKMATARMGDSALRAVVRFQRKARAGELVDDPGDEDDPFAFVTSMWATPFLPNLLNTAVFLVETSQMVAVLFVNYKGRPWMKGLTENHALFLSLFASIGGICLCAWSLIPEVNNALHLSPFPDDQFAYEILYLVLASLFGTLLWDRLCTLLFAPRIFLAQLTEFKKITFVDLQPILVTLLKVVGVMVVLSTGNILMYGGAFWAYRQHKKKAAADDKLVKQRILRGAPEAAD